jgi:hypothetical protein
MIALSTFRSICCSVLVVSSTIDVRCFWPLRSFKSCVSSDTLVDREELIMVKGLCSSGTNNFQVVADDGTDECLDVHFLEETKTFILSCSYRSVPFR